jgi:hypothetical protein
MERNKQSANPDHEIEALFRLPLEEFTAARNALAARLKKDGRTDESAQVKSLAKPSVSAWAVNQLFWNERKAFDRLIDAGERIRRALLSEMRGPTEMRREAIATLSRAAEALLRDSGHNPAPDTMRRIATTLEALSADPQEHAAGQLTTDLSPPGFELLASLFPNTKPAPAPAPARLQEESREAINARASLREAEQALSEAREEFRNAEAERQDAEAKAKEAERQRDDAKERFDKASAAAIEARKHAGRVAATAKSAAESLKAAERAMEKASQKLG